MRKKILRWGLVAIGIAFIAVQVIRPERTNPAFDRSSDISALPGADSVLGSLIRRACYDCHSFETRWPWYSEFAPGSWLVANDVQTGRRHVNFSIWGKYPATRRAQSLEDIQDQVSAADMPLPKYLMLHPDARLTQADRDYIVAWAKKQRDSLNVE